MNRFHSLFFILLGTVLIAPPSVAGESPRRVLEELIVTSDTKIRDWQDTSDSVVVISETQHIDQGFDTLADIAKFTPGIFTLSNTLIGVRGVAGDTSGKDPVALNIEGFSHPIRSGSIGQMLDVKSAEIYRGPQVINFGPYASAGAVNIIRWNREENAPNYIRASYGQNHEFRSEAAYGRPISHSAGFRVAGRLGRQNTEQTLPGLSGDNPLSFALRGAAFWTPVDTISLTANADYAEDQNQVQLFDRVDCLALTPCVRTPGSGAEQNYKSQRLSLKSDINLGAVKAVLISGYQEDESRFLPSRIQPGGTESFDKFSQELRFISTSEGAMEWQIGAKYSRSEHLLPNAVMLEDDTWSIFTNSNAQLGDHISIDLGAQYANQNSARGGQDRGFDFWQYQAALNYRHKENNLTYAKYTRTVRPGGWNPASTYAPEQGYHFELGHKLKAVNKRVEISGLIFASQYDEFQFPIFDTTSTRPIIQNAPTVNSRGVEIDGRLAATSRTVVTANIAFLDSTFESDLTPCQPNLATLLCSRAGRHTPYAPQWSYRLGVEWIFPLSQRLGLTVSGDISVTDSYDTSANFEALGRQTSFHTANLRASLSPKDTSWFIAVYGRNLANTDITGQFIPAGGPSSGYLLQGQNTRYGAEIGHKF